MLEHSRQTWKRWHLAWILTSMIYGPVPGLIAIEGSTTQTPVICFDARHGTTQQRKGCQDKTRRLDMGHGAESL